MALFYSVYKNGRDAFTSVLLCIVIVGTCSTQRAAAQDTTNAWYRNVSINGLVMSSTTYNFNHPTDGQNQFRIFDVDAYSILLDLVSLTVRHDATPGEAGFRADISLGPYIPHLEHSAGLDLGNLDLLQGYISYIVPIGRGLTVDVGKFVCPAGYEYIERSDGINDNASHTFLFGYAIPFTHTGVRVTYPLSDQWTLQGMLVNGWDDVVDNNDAKTVCGTISWTPPKVFNVALTAISGPERSDSTQFNRIVGDLVASAKIASFLTLGVNLDAGREQTLRTLYNPRNDTLVVTGQSNGILQWQGVAGYARITISDKFALCLRAEAFDDSDGFRTGISQSLHSYTITPEWKPASHVIVRGDLRYDLSSEAVFDKNGAKVRSQPTTSINVLYTF